MRFRPGFVGAAVLMAGLAAAAQTPDVPHTIDETERLAVAALAAVLKVPASAITVAARGERTWPDAAFGCAPRKGVFEPQPTPGFAFTLAHDGRRYDYRSDRYGHVRRCTAPARPGRPVGPVSRTPRPPAGV